MIPDDDATLLLPLENSTGPETVADGLGPMFNGVGCGECHVVPTLGGSTQLTEKRAGFFDGQDFIEHPGGSLIQDRSTVLGLPGSRVPGATNVMTQRATISVFGDGFVEALSNTTLQNIANNQPQAQRGQIIDVPVLERQARPASAASAGRTSRPACSRSRPTPTRTRWASPARSSRSRTPRTARRSEEFDLPGVDDEGVDVELFALFMRETKAPPVDSRAARAPGRQRRQHSVRPDRLCRLPHAHDGDRRSRHVDQRRRAQGGQRARQQDHPPLLRLPAARHRHGRRHRAERRPSTRNKVRTAPLWGLHTRGRFMHDAVELQPERCDRSASRPGAQRGAKQRSSALSNSNGTA